MTEYIWIVQVEYPDGEICPYAFSLLERALEQIRGDVETYAHITDRRSVRWDPDCETTLRQGRPLGFDRGWPFSFKLTEVKVR